MNVWCHLINILFDMMLNCAAYAFEIYNLVYYTEQVTLLLSAQFIKCDHNHMMLAALTTDMYCSQMKG
jgi:hypothetical protein